MNLSYRITFFSEWHCSSGLSLGSDLDSMVIKENEMYPFVPGKTMKGLIRDAVESLLLFQGDYEQKRDLVEDLFGVSNREQHKQGCAFFSDATLSEALKVELLKNSLYKSLYHTKSSTKIDSSGIACTGSLRKIETTIPCELYGTIMDLPENMSSVVQRSLGLIKQLGSNRTRGMGRCLIEPIEKGGLK